MVFLPGPSSPSFAVPASLNLVAASPTSLTVAAVLLVLTVLARLLLFPSKRHLSLTELNTALNRHDNGGTGAALRTWRRALLPPLRYGDEDELAGAGIEAEEKAFEGWTITSRPVPSGLKGCLKRAEQFEAQLRAAPAAAVFSPSSPAASLASSPSPASPASPGPLPPSTRKSVRVVEPALGELDALRALWSSPEMGGSGIGGYRRTRDFYSRSQGGTAVIKKPVEDKKDEKEKKDSKEKEAEMGLAQAPDLVGKVIPASKPDEDELLTTEEEDNTPVRERSPVGRSTRRPPRLAPPTAPGRTASLSPTPHTRRSLQRTLSPSSLSVLTSSTVKVSPTRRRALSPTVAPSPRSSASSAGDRAGAASTVPRWVKTKGGRLASPAPAKPGLSPASSDASSQSSRSSKSGESGSGEEEEEEEEEVDAFDSEAEVDAAKTEQLSSPPPSPKGLAKLAAATPPSAPPAFAPSSPASSTFSATDESEVDSPTPSLLFAQPSSTPPTPVIAKLTVPALVVSPSTPPLSTSTSPFLLHTSSASSGSPDPPATSDTPKSPSPSPCAQKERRLSLRVQQALGGKKGRQAVRREAVEA
ncbi:hypothetical protein JCM10213_009229 [Rhodosporidiobolus nylandii]